MCVQLASAAMSAEQQIQTGQNLQAFAGAAQALGDLAAGATRARMMQVDAAGSRATAAAKARRIARAGDQALGQARADATAAGVSVSSDSVLEAERQIQRGAAQDAGVALLTGENSARSAEIGADYYRAAGINSALDGLVGTYGKWKLSRNWQPSISSTRASDWQLNPVSDGFSSNPQAGP